MSRYTYTSSSTRTYSGKSSYDSTFSRSSKHSHMTNNTSCSDTPIVSEKSEALQVLQKPLVAEPEEFRDEGLPRSSVSSVDTYASTVASQDDLSDTSAHSFPKERRHCFAPDSIPTNPSEFGKLFPSTRRLMVQHDDSTYDGNMNLRVDTDVQTASGKTKKMTLFHLRMKDLAERQFSLRRYCRDSGREVASSKRRYIKPPPPKSATQKPAPPRRVDSGYEADDDDDDDDEELEEALRTFTAQAHVKANIPTSAMRLEFSNYAQVIIEPRRTEKGKEYEFEYWGDLYIWKRRMARDGGEIIYTYDLINMSTSEKVASLTPDALSTQEAEFEAAQGAWIPASSMRILPKDVSADLGDVIVATGLVSLSDDCLQRQFQQERKKL